MSHPRRAAFLLILLTAACSDEGELERRAAERALALIAAHRAPEVDLLGDWSCPAESVSVNITGPVEPDGFRFVIVQRHEQTSVTRATLASGILELDAAVAGASRLHVCRVGSVEYLVAEPPHAWLGEGPPRGLVFERASHIALDPRMNYQMPPWMESPPMQRGTEQY
jgi:hypothetical protein